jgi:hypothetical protein
MDGDVHEFGNGADHYRELKEAVVVSEALNKFKLSMIG